MVGSDMPGLPSLPGLSFRRLRRSATAERAQAALLRALVRRAADTAWGRDHGYADLAASPRIVAEFQRHVPLGDHAALAPYVRRTRDGETDVLWPGRTTVFAVSGGTESEGRVVPISREGLRYLRRATLTPGLNYLMRHGGAVDLLRGKVLSLPGGVRFGEFGPGTITGEVSGLMAYHAPAIARRIQALPDHVMLGDDWNRKLEDAARIAVHRDVRAIVMVPSWAKVFLDRVRDHSGASTTSEAIRRVWPRLRAFFSGGVALDSYRGLLESLLGPRVALLESYSASEGFFAFQESHEAPDLRLHLGSGVFYEFVPLEERGTPSATRHTVGGVRTGVDYVLHVSNASGLWSCAVDDIVRFTSTAPYRVRVVGRAREVLDRFGEAMSLEHTGKILAEVERACGERCLHVHVSYAEPGNSAAPRHHWLLEMESGPYDAALYAGRLDAAAQAHNGRYRKRREPGAMAPPRVTFLPPGATHRYLESARSRLGAQSKPVVLSEERHVAEGLLLAAHGIDPARTVDVESQDPGRRRA